MAVRAPPGFQPDDAEKRQAKAPPAPSRFRKEDLCRSVLEFQTVDDHAIQVSQMEHDNFTDLIWHLVYSTNFRTELEKVRVIFRWMTSKNMHAMTFKDGAGPGSPEEVLLSFKNKQGTYARSFEVLCRFAGLTSKILTGYAKGLDYRPGNQFKDSNYNHSWNAVLVDGNWYLIDSHWATRYLVSEKNVAENLVYEYDEFFFLAVPEHLIYSHWSQETEWQLLDRPVSLQEFEAMPLVKSYFFKCAMYFVSHHNGVIGTKNGRITLTLGYKKPTNFSFKVTFAENGDEEFQGQKLKNYALLHHGKGQTDTLVFRAPRAGAYYFSFFAQLLTGEVGVKSTFTAACEYKVVADSAAADAVPVPVCSDSTWGPGFAVEQLGLTANPPEGLITTTNGKVCLEFRKTMAAYVLCKLRRNGVEEEELEKYIHDVDFEEGVQVTIQLPSKGEYGIEVYGNNPATDGDTYTHVCQYYVHYATLEEQQRAFYQDSPERQATMEGFVFTTTAPARYQAGSAGLESGTASLSLSDPDSLPPPPPELLDQHQYMAGTVPDTHQQQRYMSGSAPDTYQQQQQFVSGNVRDPHLPQYMSADARQQQQFVSATAPGTYQQQPYVAGSVGEPQQAQYMSASVPDSRQQQHFVAATGPGTYQQQPYVAGSVGEPQQAQYMSASVPDSRQQQQFISATAPGTYQQQPYVAGSVGEPQQAQYMSASVPDSRQQQQQYVSATAPGTYQQQPYVTGSIGDPQQPQYMSADARQQQYVSPTSPGTYQQQPYVTASVGDPQQPQLMAGLVPDQRQQVVVSEMKFVPAGGEKYSGDRTPATLQMNFTAPGAGQSVDDKNVCRPGEDQQNVLSPSSAQVVFTTGPGQRDIRAPEASWAEVYAPGQKDVHTATQVVYNPGAAAQADQKELSAPSSGPKTATWTPGGQKEVYAPDAGTKNVWATGSTQKDSDTLEKKKPPPTYKKPSWPPAQKDSEAPAQNVWKPGSSQKPADAPSAYQKVTYTPDIIKKPSWTPSRAQKDADAPGQKNLWKPGSAQPQEAAVVPGPSSSEQKVTSAPPPVARKPTWTPNSAQREVDGPSPNVWKPGMAQTDREVSGMDQKNVHAPVTMQRAVWAPGSSQRDADAPATAAQKNVWAPPSSAQKNVWTPGGAGRNADAPSAERRDVYAPGTERKDVYAPGTEQKGIYAPGTERKDVYAPETEQKGIYAPGTERKDVYAPGTEQKGIHAPGTERKDVYAPGTEHKGINAPGTERKDVYAPGTEQKGIYAPGTERKDVYAPGTERKDVYAPGTERKDVYAPGTEQKAIYATGTERNNVYTPGAEQSSMQAPGQKNAWTPGGSTERNVDTLSGGGPRTVYAPGSGSGLGYVPVSAQMNIAGLPQQVVVTSMAIPASTRPLEVQKRNVGQAPPAAPQEFQLLAVNQDKGEAPPPVPAPGPQEKPTLQAIDQQVLQSVDDHALQVSKSDHNSFKDLLWDLIYSKNITNEIEKVRVIFCWLASKNLKEMNFDRVEKGSPEEVLMGLKTGVTTYAMLFDIMCSYAGLHSKIIGGYAKGADYIPGMKFTPGQNQHTWNAVYIYGTWCLVDAHWGARRLVGKQTSVEDFHYQLDEYFFLTDPHQLIYTHLPDDARWQLLDGCITLQEFENMPHMKPQFFKFGLEFATHRSAVIQSRGEVQVRLKYPAERLAVAFNFTLQFENGEEEYEGVKLNRFGMQDKENGVATFNLRLPVSASYIIFIYAKEDTGNKKEGVYSQVCEYKIEHKTAPGPEPQPFPPAPA
ncbi:hypothetical protein ACOMHN_036076 [Nucella lapillus]